MKRFAGIIVVALLAGAIYLAVRPDGGFLTSDVSARDEIREILREEALGFQPVPSSAPSASPVRSPSQPGLGEAIEVVIGERDSRGYAVVTGANLSTPEFQAQQVENQVDSLVLAPFEDTIARAFDSSPEGVMLRRIVLARRHPERIEGGAKLEDLYVQELAVRTDSAIASIQAALRALPKEEFREEHVFLRDLVNRLPGGYERLQAALPDEEFK